MMEGDNAKPTQTVIIPNTNVDLHVATPVWSSIGEIESINLSPVIAWSIAIHDIGTGQIYRPIPIDAELGGASERLQLHAIYTKGSHSWAIPGRAQGIGRADLIVAFRQLRLEQQSMDKASQRTNLAG